MPSHAYPKGSLGAILVILGYQNLISPHLCRHPSMFTSGVFELKRRFSALKRNNGGAGTRHTDLAYVFSGLCTSQDPPIGLP